MAVTALHRTATAGLEYKPLHFHGTCQAPEKGELPVQKPDNRVNGL